MDQRQPDQLPAEAIKLLDSELKAKVSAAGDVDKLIKDLDADAFEAFKETGLFDQETAAAFRQHILERRGSGDPEVLYLRFRGQEPTVEALLKRRGWK